MPNLQPNLRPLAVSIGEPSGIGADVLIKAVQLANAGDIPALPDFVVLADPEHLTERAKTLAINVQIKEVDQQVPSGTNIPVIPIQHKFRNNIGSPDTSDGPGVIESIDEAVSLVRHQRASAVVTLPINKASLYKSGFSFPGHTEYLGHLARHHFLSDQDTCSPVMMLASSLLRTVPITIHTPLRDIFSQLSPGLIVETVTTVAGDLTQRLGIKKPRIAIAGLNPHAGEDGTMGTEDLEIILPAIVELRSLGVHVTGPLPADTMFHPAARERYDVAICMYHDQALIPAKTLAFDDAVNVTLGLPFIRTSPDHGTAFDIAGTGKANPSSFIAAMRMASEMAGNELAVST